jgi:type IV pilus assembly protein PilB
MGVDAYMVATSLIGVVAQRLTKVLCTSCREQIMSNEDDNKLMEIDESVPIYKAVGCPKCNNTGYTGRTAIHEILLATTKMKEIIAAGAKAEEIQDLAKEEGCRLLRDNVSELVKQGVTTIDELVRVTYAV